MAKESDLLLAKQLKMKRTIEIPFEVMEYLMNGKCVEGSLRIDQWTGNVTFKAYNRKPRRHYRDRLIETLEHGWVKESAERIKVYESIPKKIGALRVCKTLERETMLAEIAILEKKN